MHRSTTLCFRQSVPSLFKIAIAVKQVVDHSIKVRVKDGKVNTDAAKKSVNPFDEIALEEAVRLKEKGIASELIAISVGAAKSADVLRNALAMGCDKAIHVATDNAVDSLTVATIFAKIHQELLPNVWLMGKQAIDDDSGCCAQLLGGMLALPVASFASKIDVFDRKMQVTREVDSGAQVVEVQMPCVVTADLRLNTPRYLKLPNIMKARKKTIETRDISSFDINSSLASITALKEPVLSKMTTKVENIDELLANLRGRKII